jgi:hypothetical protein
MTKEEALKVLDTIPTIGEQVDALEMAIKALEQEPCEDCISRKAVLGIKTIAPIALAMNGEAVQYKGVVFVRDLEKLPPVTPQPKIGEWLEKEVNSDNAIEEWQSARCSVCDRYHTTPYMYYFSDYNFCPNCGCQMKGENE